MVGEDFIRAGIKIGRWAWHFVYNINFRCSNKPYALEDTSLALILPSCKSLNCSVTPELSTSLLVLNLFVVHM